MEEQYCDECEGRLCKHNYAPYFCGHASCLQYYCEGCWDRMHIGKNEDNKLEDQHYPMVRTGDQTRVSSNKIISLLYSEVFYFQLLKHLPHRSSGFKPAPVFHPSSQSTTAKILAYGDQSQRQFSATPSYSF